MTRFKLPPFSRRRIIGAGAATLIGPSAFAQSVLGGGDATPAPAAPSGGSSGGGSAINVSGAQNQPIPIAIAPFDDSSGNSSNTGAQITNVIGSDLTHSGLFRALDSSSFVPNSVNNGTPVWQNWSLLGAQGLVTGSVSDAGGGQLRV